MRPRTLVWLEDLRMAGELIAAFVEGHSAEDYLDDALLRSAVERQLEIVGEALRCLHREDRDVAASLEGYRLLMALRNTLAHEYGAVDNDLAWQTATVSLPPLIEQVTVLIAAAEEDLEPGS